jgi:cell division protein ZapA
MMDALKIKINIAERFYAIKIKPEEEEITRLAAKIISDKIRTLKEKQSGKDVQDWLSMACLWFALKFVENEHKSDMTEVVKGIQNFEQQISDYLECAEEEK